MSLVLKTEKGTFTVRKPRLDDVVAAMDFMNSLVDEDAMILRDKEVNYEEGKKWICDVTDRIAKGEEIHYFVADRDQIVASIGIHKGRWREAHTAEYAIAVALGYRRLGIAEAVSRYAIKEAKKAGVNVLTLRVLEQNRGAIKLYEKLGFRKEAVLKKRIKYKKKCRNVIVMAKFL